MPVSHLDATRDPAFAAGAGGIGDRSRCSWSTRGRGTFRVGKRTSPAVGEAGCVETVSERRVETVSERRVETVVGEYRVETVGVRRVETVGEYCVETVVPDEVLPAVIDAPRPAHPYEQPAFDLYPRLDV